MHIPQLMLSVLLLYLMVEHSFLASKAYSNAKQGDDISFDFVSLMQSLLRFSVAFLLLWWGGFFAVS